MDFLKYALIEAEKAYERGEVPIGAVIVKDNKIIARGYNKREETQDVTMHAEIIAIKEACEKIGSWRLSECEMYVTLEPCMMCMGAILQSRIAKLHIGTFNQDMGCCGSVLNLADNRRIGSFVDVIWEYDNRCSDILNNFFKNKRNKYRTKK